MNRLVSGAVAGAAGTLALDIAGYLDMVARGRSASNLPAELIRRLAEDAGLEQLSTPDDKSDDATKNRRSALGALSGYSVGISIGMLYGAASPLLTRVPLLVKAIVVGGLAMAAADLPLTTFDLTDPRTWGTVGWLSDIIPHAAYGLITVSVVDNISK